MPSTFEAALIFTIVIAPGYLFVRGFSVGRTHTLPERDLYALAQAVVASVIWGAVAYLLLHRLFTRYGLIPPDDAKLMKHGVEVARLLLAFVLAPYLVGRIFGFVYRLVVEGLSVGAANATVALQGRQDLLAKLGRPLVEAVSLLVSPPTAWDKAWARAADRGQPIVVKLKEGGSVRGITGATADLSPLPPRILLNSGQGFDDEGQPLPLSTGPGGVYIDAAEIRAVYLE